MAHLLGIVIACVLAVFLVRIILLALPVIIGLLMFCVVIYYIAKILGFLESDKKPKE